MNKKALTEADIRTKFITPALVGANGDKWDLLTQVREEVYFTKGRVIVRGKTVKRGVARRADYILVYRPNIPLALIEAKDNNHAVGDGMQQALDCAETLDIPFVYSSNGDAFLEQDRTVTTGLVGGDQGPLNSGVTRYYIDDVEVRVVTERVQYLDADGMLITESLRDYSRKTLRKAYASLDAFLNAWNDAERKQVILEELVAQGVFLDELAEQVGRDYDAFDLICHVAFDQPPLTRQERAEKVRKRNVFGSYGDQARAVLDALLQKYADAGIEANFPTEFRTRETADLFLVLLMKLLKPGGRAGLVLPDGTLFGEGVKTRIKEALLTDCNLHSIVRLPNGVFNPYTSIRTNLLFFTKGAPTTHVWYYEHPYPPGAKSYNKGKPIRIEEFAAERAWWGDEQDGFKARVENEQAWRVSIDTIKAGNFNLDLKNPHNSDTGPGDLDHLLPEYEKLLAQIAETRAQLKAQLMEALTR